MTVHLNFFNRAHFKQLSLTILILTSAVTALLTLTPAAKAESYLGVELGLGVPTGTGMNQDSGIVLGATAGYRLTPDLGVALTFQHDGLKLTNGGQSISENQLLAEVNFFNLFFLASGLHLGTVYTSVAGVSSTDLGFGMHSALDIKVTNDISVGGAVYWTYVTSTNDKHSLFNFVVPVKYWF